MLNGIGSNRKAHREPQMKNEYEYLKTLGRGGSLYTYKDPSARYQKDNGNAAGTLNSNYYGKARDQ